MRIMTVALGTALVLCSLETLSGTTQSCQVQCEMSEVLVTAYCGPSRSDAVALSNRGGTRRTCANARD
jgi:hypothetical protein